MSYYSRIDIEAKILSFLQKQNKAGLVFLRGRRRVGKSSVLKKLQKDNPDKCFYFTGALDERGSETIRRFCLNWQQFNTTSDLAFVDINLIDWGYIFKKIIAEIERRKTDCWIFIDEIQWLASSRNGFVSLFKEAWLDFQKIKRLKIILCGSSNKFFIDHVGGEEKILRGIATRSDIFLRPFYPAEVAEYYGSTLSKDELIFLYFCFGGIPFYLEQFDFKKGFRHGFNSAVLTEKTIFLNEHREILKLDFNKKSLPNSQKIFSAIKERRANTQTILTHSRLAESTLSENLAKLVDYGLIRDLTPENSRKNMYYYTDFYLNFYFRFLAKHSAKIKGNNSDNIFSSFISTKGNLYIDGFSGIAFENYFQFLVENLPRENVFFETLEIGEDEELECVPADTTDLIIQNEDLKLTRAIECKWTNNQGVIKKGIEQLSSAKIEGYDGYKVLRYLVTNCATTPALIKYAKNQQVQLIGL